MATPTKGNNAVTLLSNLLMYTPGHSGFSSYVRRVMPGIPGPRLLLDAERGAICRLGDELPDSLPRSFPLSILQRLSLSQHGVDLKAALADKKISAVYSPYCDALLSLKGIPQIITCHDLTPLYISNSRKATWRYRLWTPVHLRHATLIVAISRFVADQLIALGIPAERIEVVWNGIAVERPRLAAPASMDLVMLARHDKNKNVAYVMRAFGRLLERQPNWPGRLLVIGRHGRQSNDLQKIQRNLPRPEQVALIESIDGGELCKMLRNCLALISASTMEGFDYPVLEAKAEGLPTLISDIPVHRELHEDTSLTFGLDDDGSQLIKMITQLTKDNRLWTHLSTEGYTMAKNMSLEQQRQQIREMLTKVAPSLN